MMHLEVVESDIACQVAISVASSITAIQILKIVAVIVQPFHHLLLK